MEITEVKVKNLSDNALPEYATEGSSGIDLRASLSEEETISPGQWKVIPTGIMLELPIFLEGQVRPRSGLAAKFGITCLNSPGTIDSDYRGEIKVVLINHGKEEFIIKNGDRIAQLVICRVEKISLKEQSTLNSTHRNDGGFGHTGI